MNPEPYLKLQSIIGCAIMRQLVVVELPAGSRAEDVSSAIRIFMRNHPEVFWFSHQYTFNEERRELKFWYNFAPKKTDFFKSEIDKAVRYLFQPEKLQDLSELKKVLYVYKWIAANTTYNEYSSFNQTIYSVLLNRNSVCTGYAKTAQYLLGLIGIESRLVFGKFHFDTSTNGRHVWNIVKIDGNWYHVDFCLADISQMYMLNIDELLIIEDGIMWNYFCKSTESILRNRSIENLNDYPLCIYDLDKIDRIELMKPVAGAMVCKSNSGTSANIYLDPNDKNIVIKIANNNRKQIGNEYKLLNLLVGCTHIIQIKGLTDNGIELEQLTPWGELLNSHYYHIDECQLKDILIQLAEGLIESRNKGITYFDIHYNNVFVSKDGIFKWGDFGIAYPVVANGSIPHHMIGHDGVALGCRWFMAPETYHNRIYTESSAIYSLAMLAYFVMNGMCPPFLTVTTSQLDALDKRLSSQPINLPEDVTDYPFLSWLACEILNSEPSARIKTFEEFIALLSSTINEKAADESNGIDLFAIEDLNTDAPIDDWNCSGNDLKSDDDVIFAQTMGPCCERLDVKSDYFMTSLFQSRDTERFATSVCYSNCSGLSDEDRLENIVFDNGLFDDSYISFGAETYSAATIPLPPNEEVIHKHLEFCAEMLPDTDNKERQSFTQKKYINACIYAPAEVCLKKSFIIRVYMYLPNEKDKVDSKIKEIDPAAVKKEYKPLDLPVKEGDKLTVRLDLSEGVQCKTTTKSVIWRNHYTDCSFIAKLVDADLDSIEGTAYVFVNDIPAGEMSFIIDVVESQPRELYTEVVSRRFSKIFISYSHRDANQVKGFAECCKMLGTDYFFDRHTLKPGDIFKEKILEYINGADLFVLCWSKNAAESEWVQIEREHALQLIQKGKSSLSIYPLCLQPVAPLPIDMADKYNFGTL